MSAPSALPPALAGPVARLRKDLEEIFGPRLRTLVAHGPCVRRGAVVRSHGAPLNTVALIDGLSYKDLVGCAQRSAAWLASGLGVPLLLSSREFERSLDVYPMEYGDILAHHVVVCGEDPFVGLEVNRGDLRRACEAWAKSHMIQLREGFVEVGGDAASVARLIVSSSSPFTGLLTQVAKLRGHDESTPDGLARAVEGIAGVPHSPVSAVVALETTPDLDADTAMTLYPAYLDAVEKLVSFLDRWSQE